MGGGGGGHAIVLEAQTSSQMGLSFVQDKVVHPGEVESCWLEMYLCFLQSLSLIYCILFNGKSNITKKHI